MNRPANPGIQIVLAVLLSLMFSCTSAGTKDTKLIAELDSLAQSLEHAPLELEQSIQDCIEQDPSLATASLVPRLADPATDSNKLAVYAWALGLAKDPRSVDGIISLAGKTASAMVRENCFRALATIGGTEAGDFLLSTLDSTTDTDRRFALLSWLGQLQYEAALPRTLEVLNLDPAFFWQSIFVFGKMGDKAVPFLLDKVNDTARNVRGNAISLLGQWLISPEAAPALRERYWKEEDVEIRGLILGSLERITSDLALTKALAEEVVAREQEKTLVQFAQETLTNLQKTAGQIDSLLKAKAVSSEKFQKAYAQLYKSVGKEGDYKVLLRTSSSDVESELKRLRERILQRGSDEALYDYQEVNNIIILNRLLQNRK